MNAIEVNALLLKAAMYDARSKPRDPEDAANQAEAWAEALTDVTLEDGLEALRIHQRESPEVVKVFHVIQIVKRIRSDRSIGQGVKSSHVSHPAPRPLNEAAMAAAWDDEAAYLVQEDIYNEQLAAAGLPPVSGTWRGGRDSVRRRV